MWPMIEISWAVRWCTKSKRGLYLPTSVPGFYDKVRLVTVFYLSGRTPAPLFSSSSTNGNVDSPLVVERKALDLGEGRLGFVR